MIDESWYHYVVLLYYYCIVLYCIYYNILYLQENAHFSISEALIAAIEQMKWNHIISPHTDTRMEEPDEEESDEEIKQLQQRIRIRKREKLKEVSVSNDH